MEQSKLTTITPTICSTTPPSFRRRKRKIIIILGPTGAGKSRLSIDIATRLLFTNCEIINSDKMQVYKGLDITTNKITLQQQLNIPHHLLGVIDPTKTIFTPSDFRKLASEIISDVKSRRGLPIIVGGSNSLIHSLVTKRYDPKTNFFVESDPNMDPDRDTDPNPLRYDCCFIWVDVCLPVLNQYLSKRVDEMLDSGMFEELGEFFRSGEHKRVKSSGLGQAIGVPEFETYFEKFPGFRRPESDGSDSGEVYSEAVKKIKENTCQLAKKQVSKILRLRDAGWDLKKIDATEAFRAVVTADCGGGRVAEIWEKQVVEPSMKIVMHFLDE
ncbi:hypothetical protein QVD17_21022 [Tagetes erecta]|uniref:Adenylate isopentenyltransferase n=1 Tax=Tagetes erecta TaxID=13708 RepID=A0AAD8KSR3_TARER|nr:hypothetical protein QVD17_21022 [Tagetes erecta]